ncbi:MAG: PP2C family protein-serine/threonine phosphatase, partial [Nocardioidaceae bacterium]
PERPELTAAEAAAAVEVAERAARVLEHAHSYDQVRTLSEQLQRSMLTEPVQPEGIEIAVSYTPASQAAQVGGDWYDAFVQPDGATMVVVGDVIGHDSASAAAMGHLRALTRGIAYSTGDSPAGVLTAVACAMDGLDVDTIATAVLARLQRDPDTGLTRMTWSSAGHPPALLRRPDGSTELLESEDLLLGLVADAPREDHHLVLEPGSVVLMFTDGLVERRGEAISVGLSRLQAVVDEGHDLVLPDLLAHLHRELLPMDPDDDVAVLALQTVPVAGAGGLTAPAV